MPDLRLISSTTQGAWGSQILDRADSDDLSKRPSERHSQHLNPEHQPAHQSLKVQNDGVRHDKGLQSALTGTFSGKHDAISLQKSKVST